MAASVRPRFGPEQCSVRAAGTLALVLSLLLLSPCLARNGGSPLALDLTLEPDFTLDPEETPIRRKSNLVSAEDSDFVLVPDIFPVWDRVPVLRPRPRPGSEELKAEEVKSVKHDSEEYTSEGLKSEERKSIEGDSIEGNSIKGSSIERTSTEGNSIEGREAGEVRTASGAALHKEGSESGVRLKGIETREDDGVTLRAPGGELQVEKDDDGYSVTSHASREDEDKDEGKDKDEVKDKEGDDDAGEDDNSSASSLKGRESQKKKADKDEDAEAHKDDGKDRGGDDAEGEGEDEKEDEDDGEDVAAARDQAAAEGRDARESEPRLALNRAAAESSQVTSENTASSVGEGTFRAASSVSSATTSASTARQASTRRSSGTTYFSTLINNLPLPGALPWSRRPSGSGSGPVSVSLRGVTYFSTTIDNFSLEPTKPPLPPSSSVSGARVRGTGTAPGSSLAGQSPASSGSSGSGRSSKGSPADVGKTWRFRFPLLGDFVVGSVGDDSAHGMAEVNVTMLNPTLFSSGDITYKLSASVEVYGTVTSGFPLRAWLGRGSQHADGPVLFLFPSTFVAENRTAVLESLIGDTSLYMSPGFKVSYTDTIPYLLAYPEHHYMAVSTLKYPKGAIRGQLRRISELAV